MNFCKCIGCRLFEQSHPDCLLLGGWEIAEGAAEGLDEYRVDDGAEAGEYGGTMSEKDGIEPRVGMAKGDVDQNRGDCRENDKLNGIEHSEMVVLGGGCQYQSGVLQMLSHEEAKKRPSHQYRWLLPQRNLGKLDCKKHCGRDPEIRFQNEALKHI